MIDLTKGQKIVLGQTDVTIGLGWTPNVTSAKFDLDCSAFMLTENGKLLNDDYFIYYRNLISPDSALVHSDDDTTGESSDSDDETIKVDILKLNPNITEIVFVVTIHDAIERNQNFGQVRNSYIRIVDNKTQEEFAKYELDEDFSIETSIIFGRLYKRNNEWKFDATGLGSRNDLSYYVQQYSK